MINVGWGPVGGGGGGGGGSPAMTMMHLGYQVQHFDGFAPGKLVFGLTPEMPIGAVDNPHFRIS